MIFRLARTLSFAICLLLSPAGLGNETTAPCIRPAIVRLIQLVERPHVTLGTRANLKLPQDVVEKKDVVFLGRFVAKDGAKSEMAFFDAKSGQMHFIPEDQVEISRITGDEVKLEALEKAGKPNQQVGATCAAYTIQNCILHLEQKGLPAKTPIAHSPDYIESVIQNYYKSFFTPQTVTRLSLEQAGYRAQHLPLGTQRAYSRAVEHLEGGLPVIINYQVYGTAKTQSALSWLSHDGSSMSAAVSTRIKNWMPLYRTEGMSRFKLWRERAKSKEMRHSVLALGIFEGPDRVKRVLISDPNFTRPILWELDAFNKAMGPGRIELYLISAPKP